MTGMITTAIFKIQLMSVLRNLFIMIIIKLNTVLLVIARFTFLWLRTACPGSLQNFTIIANFLMGSIKKIKIIIIKKKQVKKIFLFF